MITVNGKDVVLQDGQIAVVLSYGVANREVVSAARSVWTDGTGTTVAIISEAALKVLTGAAP